MQTRRKTRGSPAVAAAAPVVVSPECHAADVAGDWSVTLEEAAAKIAPHLRCDSDALARFAARIYQQCVLGKIRPPAAPLKHRWLAPGGVYQGQWIWDTMFVVDLLSILPDQRDVIREVFQNYWDFQTRWDAAMPEYRHGMVANVMFLERPDKDWKTDFAYSQIPILSWGLERVYQRTKDLELVRQCLGPLERFHEWYWRERDVADTGLVGLGDYSGDVQHARFETFDFECNLDDMQMTPHPQRKGAAEGAWYGNVCVPGNTAYLLMGEQSLARLAEIAGDPAMAERRRKRLDRGVLAMREHMWDRAAGTFLAVDRDSLKKIPVATIGSWIPLTAGVPTQEMAARMAETLATDDWMTPLPVPTVGRHDPRWKSDGFWRGDVWPATNYQIATGLASYGYNELAAKIVDASVANALTAGISEHYDSVSGKPLGVGGLGMSCTLLAMVLDGLSGTHHARVAKGL